MSVSVIEKLVSKLTGRRQAMEKSASAQFIDLALSIANGDEPDVGHAEKVLDAAGKTPADLSAEAPAISRKTPGNS